MAHRSDPAGRRGLMFAMLLILGLVVFMAVTIPLALGLIYGPHKPGVDVPSPLNIILAGLLPSWELVRLLEMRRGSGRWVSVLISGGAGTVCVFTTLVISALLEAGTMLLWHGELRVRFAYTALVPFVFVVLGVILPVGMLVGVLGHSLQLVAARSKM